MDGGQQGQCWANFWGVPADVLDVVVWSRTLGGPGHGCAPYHHVVSAAIGTSRRLALSMSRGSERRRVFGHVRARAARKGGAARAHTGTARAARLPADMCAQVLPPAGGSSGGGRSVGPPPPAVLCAAEGAGCGCGLNAARRRPSDRPVRAPRPQRVNAAGPHTVRRARTHGPGSNLELR